MDDEAPGGGLTRADAEQEEGDEAPEEQM